MKLAPGVALNCSIQLMEPVMKLLSTVSVLALSVIAVPAAHSEPLAEPGNQALAEAIVSDKSDFAQVAEIPFDMFTLENGLRVIVHSDHSAPTIYMHTTFAVGAGDEPQGKTGFAHFFEHLLFKDTPHRDEEYFDILRRAGGSTNAFTSNDETAYFASFPSEALDLALWLESDRFIYLRDALTVEAMDVEREVVKNEKRQGEASPMQSVYQRLLAASFPKGHPYHHPIIGSMEDLDNASLDDVKAWFDKYYGASNAVLLLSGDIDLETAKEKVTHYFGAMPSGEPLPSQSAPLPEFGGILREQMYANVPKSALVRSWILPPSSELNSESLKLLQETLFQNARSPMQRELVDSLKLAGSVQSSALILKRGGIFFTLIELEDGVTREQAGNALDRVIEEYLQGGPESDLIENYEKRWKKRFALGLESATSKGRVLISGVSAANDPEHYRTHISAVESATPLSVRGLARDVLDNPYLELLILPKPELTSSEIDADRSKMPMAQINERDLPAINFPPIQESILTNGVTLKVFEDRSTPVVRATLDFKGGLALGLERGTQLMDPAITMLSRGTTKLDKYELAAEAERLTAGADLIPSEDRVGASFSVLPGDLSAVFDLYDHMILEANMPEGELEQLKSDIIDRQEALDEDPGGEVRAIFYRTLFGREVPGQHIWTKDEIEAVNRADLLNLAPHAFTSEGLTIHLYGNIDLAEAEAALESNFAKWARQDAPTITPLGKALPNKSRVLLIDHPKSENGQALIFAGQALPMIEDEHTFLRLNLANSVLGRGFQSRINMALREEKGWTYGASSTIERTRSAAPIFYVASQVQIDKTAEAMSEISRIIGSFVDEEPISEEDFDKLISGQLRALRGAYSSPSSKFGSIMQSFRNGRPYDYDATKAERVAQVTRDELNQIARDVLEPDKMTWLIVGDLSQIEEDIRALDLGEVTVIDPYGNAVR